MDAEDDLKNKLGHLPCRGASRPCRGGGPGGALWTTVEDTKKAAFLVLYVGWIFMTKNTFAHHVLNTL